MRNTRIKASPPRPPVIMQDEGLPFLPPRNANRLRDRNYSDLPVGTRQMVAVTVATKHEKMVQKQPTRPILSENPKE